MASDTLDARVIVTHHTAQGQQCARYCSTKPGYINLARDENNILSLNVVLPNVPELAYKAMGQVAIFGKNVNKGQASIHLRQQGVTLAIMKSNPAELRAFLKLLQAKLKSSVEQRRLHPTSPPTSLPKKNTIRRPLSLKQLSPLSRLEAKSPSRTAPNTLAKRVCRRADLSAITKTLSEEQQRVLQAVLQGKNVFFTGNAGTGKTWLLRAIMDALPSEGLVATASTGIAACAINGITLHSFAGLQAGTNKLPRRIEQWQTTKVLIIDEISMVHADYFDRLSKVAQQIRRNSKPFGGIQLVLVGDFLQLPPVVPGNEQPKFCFQAQCWNSVVEATFELKQIHRQTDSQFAGLLRRLRLGHCNTEDEGTIRSCRIQTLVDGAKATKLCTHVREADIINTRELARLPGAQHVYRAEDSSTLASAQSLLDKSCRASGSLELKVHAQVMLLKNLDVNLGLANGTVGVVRSFSASGFPIVEFANGTSRTVRPEYFSVKVSQDNVLRRKQLPLALAWAISIHKSQGMTLDSVQVDLSRVFSAGQAYVALSRAKRMDGLEVTGFRREAVYADPTVLKFYENLQMA